MSGKIYTAEDFANARFAEHPSQGVVSRSDPDSWWPWDNLNGAWTDRQMAVDGWAPVVEAPTITESRYARISGVRVAIDDGTFAGTTVTLKEYLGLKVVPDPEPSNAEKLAKEMLESFNRCEFDREPTWEQMASALDARGVKAPDA